MLCKHIYAAIMELNACQMEYSIIFENTLYINCFGRAYINDK